MLLSIKGKGPNPVRSLNKIKKKGELPFRNIPYTLSSLVKKPVYPDLNEKQPSDGDAGSYNDIVHFKISATKFLFAQVTEPYANAIL